MSRQFSREYYLEVAKGNIPGHSVIHKFGRNSATGTAFTPVTVGGVYQRMQPASATTLRVKAGNANDTAAGTGAREITIQGLDETGAFVQETLATAGATASSATTATFIRLYRAWVSACGSYTGGASAADVVIEDSAGAADWLTIDSTTTPEGQSEVGVYTVPLGKTAYITQIYISIEASKTVDLRLFKRGGALDSAAPYQARRTLFSWSGLQETPSPLDFKIPYNSIEELTDVGFIAQVANGTADVAVNFDLLLIDN